ncbi:peptidoglycan D,D-transpeptidase FtsI family protein [Spartinivicinus poritis]|uniref:Peptidoglycan D,D-transpeptidase FtsI n=1 Tax=Spartinivicinus poritis TaxID=2994640 RepID=A0ABT5U8T4_9GAMM|nr:penicillin-binding transpeptidase domain-containing protein [Spartinivicinus sp. A2-2]MDE1462784.1 penicillin-binding transpeptidase domain-containing protein [Spartinivicinus sp. A2-2]
MSQLNTQVPVWRFRFIVTVLIVAAALVGWRIVDLQVIDRHFLQNEGAKRVVRHSEVAATRGIIFDRNGEPLAVSTPVVTIWGNPKELSQVKTKWPVIAKHLGFSSSYLAKKVNDNGSKEFIYLKRHMRPKLAQRLLAEKIRGIYGIDEFKRYYPAGRVAAHIVGFTNIDGKGQEGIELAYDHWLTGKPGQVRLYKDRKGRLVRSAELVKSAQPGKELYLSIDLRVQNLAYRELAKAVKRNNASGGTLVILDVKTGEILAMVNQPVYNPNNRRRVRAGSIRNRAMTDIFEPGSTLKPFTIAAALEAGEFTSSSLIDTSPGYMMVGRKTIKDHRNYGVIDITTILKKSSNIGMTKIIQQVTAPTVASLLHRMGFGIDTGTGFPGESTGMLPLRSKWRATEEATLSYGYGMAVTAVQLTQAYGVLANRGKKVPTTLLRLDDQPEASQVIPSNVAHDVVKMLTSVVKKGGTGTQGAIEAYQVAGKTGTARIAEAGGYSEKKHHSVFSGLAPAGNPRLAAVVMIDNPKNKKYYGGEVAAPVFSKVVAGSLQLLGVSPDNSARLANRGRDRSNNT